MGIVMKQRSETRERLVLISDFIHLIKIELINIKHII